jgi:hypothetical protein
MDLLTSVENQNQQKKTKRVLCICVASSKVRLSSSAALYYTIVGISRLYVQLYFLVSHVRVISLNLSCIRRQRNTLKLCYRDVSSDSTVVTALYPRQPLVYRYVSSDSAGPWRSLYPTAAPYFQVKLSWSISNSTVYIYSGICRCIRH